MGKIDAHELEVLREKCSTLPDGSHRKMKAREPPTAQQIRDGHEGTDDFGWAVALAADQTDRILCTGILISSHHVVSAGHCVFEKKEQVWNEDRKWIFLGAKCLFDSPMCRMVSKTRQIIEIRSVATTKTWANPDGNDGDLAIIELAKPVEWFDVGGVEAACLLPSNYVLPGYQPKFLQWGYGAIVDGLQSMSPILNILGNVRLEKCWHRNNASWYNPHDVLCPVTASVQQRVGDGDSALIVGTLSFTDPENPVINSAYYTDLRRYTRAICEATGVCYMHKT
ncbi:unnamed protein product, partial [Mesorhabditis spiculigera]